MVLTCYCSDCPICRAPQADSEPPEGGEVEIDVQRFDVEIVPDASPVNAQLAITEGIFSHVWCVCVRCSLV